MTRVTMWLLLGLVAASAAILSFSALFDLATLCGFHERLAPLLPCVVDAGAAAGCLVWLSPKDVTTEARRFARALTWVLLASSVAGNAIVHGLSAYQRQPHWTLVVAVSAIAPAVLGAIVHLSVLVGRAPGVDTAPAAPIGQDNSKLLQASPSLGVAPSPVVAAVTSAPSKPKRASVAEGSDDLVSRTEQLLPIGRRALAKHLDVSEHMARELLRQAKPRNGHRVLEESK